MHLTDGGQRLEAAVRREEKEGKKGVPHGGLTHIPTHPPTALPLVCL